MTKKKKMRHHWDTSPKSSSPLSQFQILIHIVHFCLELLCDIPQKGACKLLLQGSVAHHEGNQLSHFCPLDVSHDDHEIAIKLLLLLRSELHDDLRQRLECSTGKPAAQKASDSSTCKKQGTTLSAMLTTKDFLQWPLNHVIQHVASTFVHWPTAIPRGPPTSPPAKASPPAVAAPLDDCFTVVCTCWLADSSQQSFMTSSTRWPILKGRFGGKVASIKQYQMTSQRHAVHTLREVRFVLFKPAIYEILDT